MTDPLQQAVEVLARALGRFTAAEWQWQMDFSQRHGLDVLHGNQARALLAEIAPMIEAAEREACAKLCEDNEAGIQFRGATGWALSPRMTMTGLHPGEAYAAAIRERGKA